MLNMKNSKNLVINKLFKDGYCIIENFLNKHECRKIILEIENLKKKLSKNKKFKNERLEYGQEVIRDLPLRNPDAFLSLIDRKFIINVLDNIFKETFILDNCQASGATNVKSNYDALVHIDSHQTSNILSNTTDIVVCFCLNDFKKENGATKIWPKSHLSKKRIQNDKEYKKKIKKKFIYAEAKQGSIIFFLGQTWHQIGNNSKSETRWGILCHYKRWWIKPSTDWTKCGSKIFKKLSQRQKVLFGFTSISPKLNLKTKARNLKTLRQINKLGKNYHSALNY